MGVNIPIWAGFSLLLLLLESFYITTTYSGGTVYPRLRQLKKDTILSLHTICPILEGRGREKEISPPVTW
jgi:hypothetical protein